MVDTPVPATSERNVTGSRLRSIAAARSISNDLTAGSFLCAIDPQYIAMLCFGYRIRDRHPPGGAMAVTLFNPEGLPKPEIYRQLSIATGSRWVFLAGQVALSDVTAVGRAGTADGGHVGEGDLAAQVEQAFVNVGTAMTEIGGSFDDVAKLTIYVVDWSEDKLPLLGEGVARAAARLGVDPTKPVTLIGVAGLGEPDLLVEVEATAVLD
jgi:enamine deaminase RidA (YjgF/YER057c/UK114 family)